MKIFINYQLTNAFRMALNRDRLDAIDHHWQAQKAFCLIRKSTYKSYDTAILHGFRWYEVL